MLSLPQRSMLIEEGYRLNPGGVRPIVEAPLPKRSYFGALDIALGVAPTAGTVEGSTENVRRPLFAGAVATAGAAGSAENVLRPSATGAVATAGAG